MEKVNYDKKEDVLQSLFYWKSFCNNTNKCYALRSEKLQSLFYWKSFCNPRTRLHFFWRYFVTILILLEIILQPSNWRDKMKSEIGYNPYFIGNHSATFHISKHTWIFITSYNPYFIGNHSATANYVAISRGSNPLQSLFYWKSFCNKVWKLKRVWI